MDQTIFFVKRAEMPERFLAHERIYGTGKFPARYEQPARRNLRESIEALRAGAK